MFGFGVTSGHPPIFMLFKTENESNVTSQKVVECRCVTTSNDPPISLPLSCRYP